MGSAREHVAHWLFGISPEAHLRLTEREVLDDGRARLHFAVDARLCAGVGTLVVESALVGAAAATNIAAALCATAATGADAEALQRAACALKQVSAVPGRLNLRTMPSGVRVLDDTYNASPRAVRAALDAARELATRNGARLIAVLGDMLELGVLAAEEHTRVGVLAAEAGVALMAAVGPEMRAAADAARAKGVAIERFDDASHAARWLCGAVRPGDVVLVKGSRGMRMERCVAALDTLGESSR
jgi:UDP-N-acetylmuramoyl-tripeptide--D-alanyl-D-alanine ligase